MKHNGVILCTGNAANGLEGEELEPYDISSYQMMRTRRATSRLIKLQEGRYQGSGPSSCLYSGNSRPFILSPANVCFSPACPCSMHLTLTCLT